MYIYSAIRSVHLEITDKCNAACPQCPRSEDGGKVNPSLPLVELTLADIQKIIPPGVVHQLRSVWCAGSYGDAIVARDTLEIIRYLRSENPEISLGIHTNGGARSAEWWAQLGSLLPRGRGYVRFGIDGLEDTNHIYRRNVNWSVLMRSIHAFIAAGGNAEWDFLVFRHNEHQVDEARRLAKQLGFTLFNTKLTSRFFSYGSMAEADRSPVRDRDGNIVYYLERAVGQRWNNSGLVNVKPVKERYGSVEIYAKKVEISCKAAAEQSISVTADGLLLPCCWMGSEVHKKHRPKSDPFEALINAAGGWDQINAKKHSIEDIVGGRFYQELLPGSWNDEVSPWGRVFTCAAVCGKALDLRGAQWKEQAVLA